MSGKRKGNKLDAFTRSKLLEGTAPTGAKESKLPENMLKLVSFKDSDKDKLLRFEAHYLED